MMLGDVVRRCVAVAIVVASMAGGLRAQDSGEQAIVIPAVSFSAQEGGEVKKVEPRNVSRGAEGYVHFWYTPGHWLEWTVETAAAGDYEVTVRCAGKHDVERSLAVNGKPVEALKSFKLKRTGRWSTWQEARLPAPVTLAAGRNVLRMTCLDNASIRLSDLTLSAAGKGDTVVKASQFTAQGGGRVQVLTPPTLGTISGLNKQGHWLEWTIDDAKAGTYRMEWHYTSDGLCQLEFQVNGEKLRGLEAFIPPLTGDDSFWTVATLPVAVRLADGKNVLRLTRLGGGEERRVPTLDGEFGLSAIRLIEQAGRPARRDNEIELTTAAALARSPEEALSIQPAPLGPPLPEAAGAVPLSQGTAFALAGRKAIITTADVLPYVDDKWTKRFEFENYDNPKLREFREKYKLDEVVAAGKDEFEKQVMLMKWVWDQWDFGHGRERYHLGDPFEILDEAKREHKFQCMHSGAVLLTAANALGWVARPMAIPKHTFNEIWSNQHRKWIMFDATSNYLPEKDGRPLNTYEHRQALLREGGGVLRARMGDSGMERSAQRDSYGQRLLFIGYITNTDYLVRGPQYGGDKFFITKDELCEGRGWHTRDCPDDPAVDPYFPVNQAAMTLVPDGRDVKVTLGTMTPNFKEFHVRIDGGEWKTSQTAFTWQLHDGANKLEARSVNKFDVPGPVSTVEVTVK